MTEYQNIQLTCSCFLCKKLTISPTPKIKTTTLCVLILKSLRKLKPELEYYSLKNDINGYITDHWNLLTKLNQFRNTNWRKSLLDAFNHCNKIESGKQVCHNRGYYRLKSDCSSSSDDEDGETAVTTPINKMNEQLNGSNQGNDGMNNSNSNNSIKMEINGNEMNDNFEIKKKQERHMFQKVHKPTKNEQRRIENRLFMNTLLNPETLPQSFETISLQYNNLNNSNNFNQNESYYNQYNYQFGEINQYNQFNRIKIKEEKNDYNQTNETKQKSLFVPLDLKEEKQKEEKSKKKVKQTKTKEIKIKKENEVKEKKEPKRKRKQPKNKQVNTNNTSNCINSSNEIQLNFNTNNDINKNTLDTMVNNINNYLNNNNGNTEENYCSYQIQIGYHQLTPLNSFNTNNQMNSNNVNTLNNTTNSPNQNMYNEYPMNYQSFSNEIYPTNSFQIQQSEFQLPMNVNKLNNSNQMNNFNQRNQNNLNEMINESKQTSEEKEIKYQMINQIGELQNQICRTNQLLSQCSPNQLSKQSNPMSIPYCMNLNNYHVSNFDQLKCSL